MDPGKARVVILAGQRDFGRCHLASDLPTPLWPVVAKPAIRHILDSLADQGIVDAVICSNGEGSILADSVRLEGDIEFEFIREVLPVGTAGALRNAARNRKNEFFIVMPASMVSVPKVKSLLEAHQAGQCELTVMFNPSDRDSGQLGRASGIYVCTNKVLEHIPDGGYFDIKEGLIPELVRAGKSVHAAILPNHAGNFRDRSEYLRAVSDYLGNAAALRLDKTVFEQNGSGDVWISKDAEVDSSARICGPVVIMHRTKVSSDAVILGPTVLGNDVEIGHDAVVVGSVVWDGAKLEAFLVSKGA